MVVTVPEVEPERDQSKIMTDEHTYTEGQTPQPDRNEESAKVSSNENQMSPCVTSTSRLRESPLEVSRLKARSKLRNKSGLHMRGEGSQPVCQTLTEQPSTLNSTKAKAKTIVKETLESDAATDEETGTHAGGQPQPPSSKKNLVMPLKTEVISVIKGVVSGANAKSTANQLQKANQQQEEILVIAEDVDKEQAQNSVMKNIRATPVPVEKKPIQQKMFKVPIADKNKKKKKNHSPIPLEKMFSGCRNRANFKQNVIQQTRHNFSPSMVDPQDLNLTTEQLFRVIQQNASPAEVIRTEKSMQQDTNTSSGINSAATFQGKKEKRKKSKEVKNQATIKRQFQVQIKPQQLEKDAGHPSSKASVTSGILVKGPTTNRVYVDDFQDTIQLEGTNMFSNKAAGMGQSQQSQSIVSGSGGPWEGSPKRLQQRFSPIFDVSKEQNSKTTNHSRHSSTLSRLDRSQNRQIPPPKEVRDMGVATAKEQYDKTIKAREVDLQEDGNIEIGSSIVIDEQIVQAPATPLGSEQPVTTNINITGLTDSPDPVNRSIQPRKSQDQSLSKNNKINLGQDFRRAPTMKLDNDDLREATQDMASPAQFNESQATVESIGSGSQTLRGLINWVPYAMQDSQSRQISMFTGQEKRMNMTPDDGRATSQGRASDMKSGRSSKQRVQNFQPRSNQLNNDIYLQISPRNFNKQILQQQPQTTKNAPTAKGWGRANFQPTPGSRNRSKRDMMRKMAGLCSKRPQAKNTIVKSPENRFVIMDPSALECATPDELKFAPITPEPVIEEKKQTPKAQTPVKTTIQIVKKMAQEDKTSKESKESTAINLNDGKRQQQALQTLRLGSIANEMLLVNDSSKNNTVEANETMVNETVVHFLQGDELNNILNQDTNRSMRVEPPTNDHSIMSEDGELQMTQTGETIDIKTTNVHYDYRFQNEQVESLSIKKSGSHAQNAKRQAQPLKTMPDPNRTSLSIQQSIHQSSHLDAESSQHPTRLTPMELKLNLNQLPATQNTSREVSKPKQTTRQSVEAKLMIGSSLVPINPFTSGSSKESGPAPSPQSQLTVRIHRTGSTRNNESAFTNGSQQTALVHGGRDSTFTQDSHGNNKQVILRQVYTNMNNMARMAKRNYHYDKVSQRMRLQADLTNTYTRRKQTQDADAHWKDGEWTFGLMQSKLREQTRLTEESVCATVGTLSQQQKDEDGASALDKRKKAESKRKPEEQSCIVHIESSRSRKNHRGSIANTVASDPQGMLSCPSTIAGRSEMVALDQQNAISGVNSIQIELKVSKDVAQAPLVTNKEDSLGSSCVSFNPVFKKSNAEHELKPRKRNWQHAQYHPSLTIQNANLPEKPQTSDSSQFTRTQVVGTSPGSNAYLNHIKARLRIKSQGQATRPRNMMKDSLNNSLMEPLDTNSVSQKASQHQVSFNEHSQMRNRESQRNEVLKQDQADFDGSHMENLSKTHDDDIFSARTRTFRTTKNSLVPESKSVMHYMTPRHQQSVATPPDQTSQNRSLQPKILAKRALLNSQRASIMTAKNPNAYTINRAKPTLFMPFHLDTARVDSFVTASAVAKALSRPGEPYHTTVVQPQLSQQHMRQKHASFTQKRFKQRTSSFDNHLQTIVDPKSPPNESNVVVNFHQALTMNREVSERNRNLRRKAFSFTKAVGKGDVCQMAQNLEDLSKKTMARIPQATR